VMKVNPTTIGAMTKSGIIILCPVITDALNV
jgi:hypothetical protein